MHCKFEITTDAADSDNANLYDILTALYDGVFEVVGAGIKFATHESGPRQIRHMAQKLDYLAGLIERDRLAHDHCPADNLELDGNGLCPNTNCIYSREDRKVKR